MQGSSVLHGLIQLPEVELTTVSQPQVYPLILLQNSCDGQAATGWRDRISPFRPYTSQMAHALPRVKRAGLAAELHVGGLSSGRSQNINPPLASRLP